MGTDEIGGDPPAPESGVESDGPPPRVGRPWKRRFRRVTLAGLLAIGVWLSCATLWLVALRWVDPPTTGVQIQRRVEALFSGDHYEKRYQPVAMSRVSVHLPRAVVAAEDTRFWQHGGIDWEAVEQAVQDGRRGRRRGGSTISQQLAKNLFLTTHSTWLRKAAEVPLTYLVEWILPKQRILELYVNVVEWGPGGVFGVEAAARHHYGTSAAALSREQSARLAACLPSPRRRAPQAMDRYSAVVRQRMSAMGW